MRFDIKIVKDRGQQEEQLPRAKKATQSGNNPKPTRRPTSRNAALANKERQALELRMAGASFDQIAQKLGYSEKGAAHRAVTRALISTVKPAADELRELETARLDRLLLAFWPAALEGDEKAADRVLRIMDQRAKLLGLNMPTKVDVDATVSVDPSEIEIVRRIREWRAARDA
jgi:hypothetical protein